MALSPRWLLVGRGSVCIGGEQRVAVEDFGMDLGTLEKTGFWGGAILGPRTSHAFHILPPSFSLFPTKSVM